ncbi:DUF4260 family protein [Agrococcus sp. KRD186]|uniref:DUF4260 family protein n=1 Tax=Agrococcus sp. KRD186 TaxID=2729730 RepID=UPI00406C4AF9
MVVRCRPRRQRRLLPPNLTRGVGRQSESWRVARAASTIACAREPAWTGDRSATGSRPDRSARHRPRHVVVPVRSLPRVRPVDARVSALTAVGAASYNAIHTYAWPAVLMAIALVTGSVAPTLSLCFALIALAWAFHVGIDRMLGYGLKLPDAFTHTHLGWIGKDRGRPAPVSPAAANPAPPGCRVGWALRRHGARAGRPGTSRGSRRR